MRRLFSIILTAAFFSIGIISVGVSLFDESIYLKKGENIQQWSQRIVENGLQLSQNLRDLAPNLLYSVGVSQQDGIFITEKYLLEDIFIEGDDFSNQNIEGIKEFCENSDIPVYFGIVPTAIAIKQEEIPSFAQIYNQKQKIVDIYKELNNYTNNIDCYSHLFGVREQYTYYRTEPKLTALGGYYVYTAMANAMNFEPFGLNNFKISHLEDMPRGSLYDRISFKKFPSDLISRYEFSQNRSFAVVHYGENGIKLYNGLYDTKTEILKKPYETSLGGYSKRIDIISERGLGKSILVMGDEKSLEILPFLALHFEKVTFLDLNALSVEELLQVDEKAFDSAAFCYSVDSFLKKNLTSKAVAIV